MAERSGVLTEAQMRLLRKARGRVVNPEQHIEALRPGYLLCQDTYFVGTIKGVGKIYRGTPRSPGAPLASTRPSEGKIRSNPSHRTTHT